MSSFSVAWVGVDYLWCFLPTNEPLIKICSQCLKHIHTYARCEYVSIYTRWYDVTQFRRIFWERKLAQEMRSGHMCANQHSYYHCSSIDFVLMFCYVHLSNRIDWFVIYYSDIVLYHHRIILIDWLWWSIEDIILTSPFKMLRFHLKVGWFSWLENHMFDWYVNGRCLMLSFVARFECCFFYFVERKRSVLKKKMIQQQ